MSNALLRMLLGALSVTPLAACGEQATTVMPPSIVFISIDTLAAGHMSLFGYDRATTTQLERLSKDAVVFEPCWANAPWTTPSYMSQFTGLQPAAFHRPSDLEAPGWTWSLSEAHDTLAERLQAAGYATAAFVDNPNVSARQGFDQGFQTYDESAAGIGLEHADGGIDHVAALGLEWLDARAPDRPFFLFLQVADVHAPYLAGGQPAGLFPRIQEPFAEAVLPLALGDAPILGAIQQYVAAPWLEDGQTSLGVRPLLNAYDEGIRAMDGALANLFAELEARGVLDDSVVILTADHGESLVAHESYFNHRLLHAEELHVPLVFWLPGERNGRRIQTDVQLVDLYPTILQLAHAGPAGPVHGRTLLGALRGEDLESRPSAAFGNFQGARSLTLGDWKLVETNPSLKNSGLAGFMSSPRARKWIARRFPELEGRVFGTYDFPPEMLAGVDMSQIYEEAGEDLGGPFRKLYFLPDDPGELHDRAAEHPERVRELLQALDEESKRARAASVPGEEAQPMDSKTKQELQKMGYLGE